MFTEAGQDIKKLSTGELRKYATTLGCEVNTWNRKKIMDLIRLDLFLPYEVKTFHFILCWPFHLKYLKIAYYLRSLVVVETEFSAKIVLDTSLDTLICIFKFSGREKTVKFYSNLKVLMKLGRTALCFEQQKCHRFNKRKNFNLWNFFNYVILLNSHNQTVWKLHGTFKSLRRFVA